MNGNQKTIFPGKVSNQQSVSVPKLSPSLGNTERGASLLQVLWRVKTENYFHQQSGVMPGDARYAAHEEQEAASGTLTYIL